MSKRSKKRAISEEAPAKESKAYRSLKALVEKRADQVFSPERESFNAADILGINVAPEKSDSPTVSSNSDKTPHGPIKPTHGSITTSPVLAQTNTGTVKTTPDMDIPVSGTDSASPKVEQPSTGTVEPTKVVDLTKEILTTKDSIPGKVQTTPGVAQNEPEVVFYKSEATKCENRESQRKAQKKENEDIEVRQGLDQHVEIGDLSADVRGGYHGPTPGFQEAMAGLHQVQGEGTVEERLQAVKIGAKLGVKFRSVLMYLNSIRNLQDPNVTVRVGYSRIAERAGVNGDYLRHKILPGLMMRGILSVVDKGLNGTVYRLEHSFSVISLIAGEDEGSDETLPVSMRVENTRSSGIAVGEEHETNELPAWIDREQWGALNTVMVQRLVERAGSIEQAQEALSILVYNETHGPEHMRVRNRMAVLTRYLQNREMQIWPNDKGFETLAIRQAKQDVEEAKRIKELAGQAIKEKREAELLSFRAALTDEQMAWIRAESKTRVSSQRGQHFIKDKFVLYKAEEDTLLEEWLERSQYGEVVPSVSSQGD